MRILRHRLHRGDARPFSFRRSPNQSAGLQAEYLVVHFTRGASAQSSINWLLSPDSRASAHLVISRGGAVTQLVAFDRRAWHAGRSAWAGREGLNACSIGMELDNHGDLVGEPGQWRTAWGRPVADGDVVRLAHKHDGQVRGWHAYTETQLQLAAQVARLLVRHYGLRDVVGHDDIAPGRKLDPGPAFPMDSFRSFVLGRDEEAGLERHETTTALNIRVGPGTEHDKLDLGPLPKGARLFVRASRGAWREVDVLDAVSGEMDVTGWVHGRYLRPAGGGASGTG